MPENDNVANPPAGGPQEQASTNDDNQNDVLRSHPHLVTVAASGQVGVVSRFSNEADASNDAAARRERLPETTEVTTRPESDLPAYVEQVEGGGSPPEPSARSTTAKDTQARTGK